MKKYLFLILSIIFSLNTYSQQEIRKVLYNKQKILNPNDSIEFNINTKSFQKNIRRYIRVIGAGQMPHIYKERGETLFREMEFLIDDYLDSLNVKNDKFSLVFNEENQPYEQCAYYRIKGNLFSNNKLNVSFFAKSQNLCLQKNGHMKVELQVYYTNKKKNPNDIYDIPDTILSIPIPEGSYMFKKIEKQFNIKQKIANVLIKIAGQNYLGSCHIEAPILKDGNNIIKNIAFKPYIQRDDNEDYWVGVNFLSKSWPVWSINYNNKNIFTGKVFDRASNKADFYIPFISDSLLTGKVSLKLLNEKYKKHVPYKIESVEIIEESADDFELVYVQRHVALNDTIGILVEINTPNTKLKLYKNKHYKWLNNNLFFKEKGLYVLKCIAKETGANIPIIVSNNNVSKQLIISQILKKNKDDIFISSGDEIYINKDQYMYDYFFKWYLRNRVGNWFQFRPSYQWSGVREINDSTIIKYIKLLNELKIPFAWQVEGRTLAASKINASIELLNSPMFKGMQAHENDGAYYYWKHFQNRGLFTDIRARYFPFGGIFAKHRPIYTEKGKFVHYDPYGIKNMKHGAETFIQNIRQSKGLSTRHTGPSTLFRYLYQAGYEWLGAEQMYGPEEVILSALRGASRAYNKENYGTLHAMQWGSFPYTDPKHSLRFFLSLATAYIHGSSHINTEEGLWIDEYGNDRFSTSGKQHLLVQNKVLDYIETHSREGKQKSNIAIIQGRNCPWKCFGRTSMWSQEGEKWKFNHINKSFDLLNIFYPDNHIDTCPPEGWFSYTPYGTIDLLPIEASNEVMKNYNILIFLGWNTYYENDFYHLTEFVKQGGTIVLSAAHLNSNLEPDKIPEFPKNDKTIRKLLGNDYRNLKEKTEIEYGKGKVIYFPYPLYPSQEPLIKEYEQCIRNLAQEEVKKEYLKGTIISRKDVGFTIWDSNEKRTIYLLNTNWKEKNESVASLVINNTFFEIPVRQYNIETIHCAHNVGVKLSNNTSDIINIKDKGEYWEINTQIFRPDTLLIFNGINGKTFKKEINKTGITTFKIKKQ